jgi:hypothetical protein
MSTADMTLEQRKLNLEKQKLAQEYLNLAKEWRRTYAKMIRALADAFGEEQVLDIAEKVWWDFGYEVGLSWREKFKEDIVTAMREKASSWHDDPVASYICISDIPVQRDDYWELVAVKCYQEVFREINEPKIGISWCLTDFAAVQGWSPNIVMRQPNNMLRGDLYCRQTREITEDTSRQWSYSRQTSEKVGWRSIKVIEEA